MHKKQVPSADADTCRLPDHMIIRCLSKNILNSFLLTHQRGLECVHEHAERY